MTSPRDRWSAPVEIDLITTGKQEINGPFEALIWLTDRWPYQRGIHFVGPEAPVAVLWPDTPVWRPQGRRSAALSTRPIATRMTGVLSCSRRRHIPGSQSCRPLSAARSAPARAANPPILTQKYAHAQGDIACQR